MSKPFIEQCIGEVVTLASPVDFDFPVGEEMYNITLSRRRLAGQRIRVFQYMTMTTSNKKLDAGPKRTYRTVGNEVREAFGFDYRDSEGRTGAWMGYAMLLPEKQATKLWSYLLRRPIAIRELTELVMTQPGAKSDVTGQPISPEVWAARRPPYEGMRRAAQGAAYIAFRTESAQSVEKSEVLAF